MSLQARRKQAYRAIGERKVLAVIGSALALTALLALVFTIWQRVNAPLGVGDYEGTIVDRWVEAGSSQGAQPRLCLAVESSDHKRFTVKVDANVYESAKVGMRIKSKAGQIVLIDTEKNRSGK